MKPRNFLTVLYFISCFLFTTGCVATSGIPSVQSTIAQDADLTEKSTFAWYQDKPVAARDAESPRSAELDKHLRRAIEEQLLKKGLKKVASDPDLLVAYDISLSVPVEKDKPSLYAPGFGYSYAYETGYRYTYGNSSIEGYRPVDLFKEGTLIIDVVDRATGQLIWRGWTEGAFDKFNASYRKVKDKVEPILSSYPEQ